MREEQHSPISFLHAAVSALFYRQEVEELTGQRNATIYWKQELEEAHVILHFESIHYYDWFHNSVTT